MKNRKQNTGMGNWHADKAFNATLPILIILSDDQWHRNMELKEKTKLSSRTLAKHLNQMINLKIIERKEDVESGKYPVPVLYKAHPELTIMVKAFIAREYLTNQLEPVLDEVKDSLMVLDAIHDGSQATFLGLLEIIQQDKDITNEEINFYAECFLWAHYRQFTSKLIEISRKMINDFDITQSLINQAKRRIKISQMLLKAYEKREQKTNHA